MAALLVVIPPSPERVAMRTNVTDRLIEDTTLSRKTITDSVTRQKVDALTDVVEMASARQELQEYVYSGEKNWSYKNNEVRYVSSSKLRDLTLKAGYTEFALGLLDTFGVTDLETSQRFPQGEDSRMNTRVYSENRYGLPPGNYDTVEAVRWLSVTKEPDYPSGRDPLRRRVLKDIKEVEEIRKALVKKGEYVLSLSAWDIGLSGKTRFLLNPGGNNIQYGWHRLPQLRGWLNGNPRSKLLKSNEKPRARKEFRPYWKTRYAEHLGRLVNRTDTEGQRLFRMALVQCPFEDLRERYSK